MSHVRKSKDKAVLRVKLSEEGLLFILNVSKEPSPSDECLFYCIKCIEQSLDNLVGYDINILFETSSVLSERYDNVAKKVCQVCEALTLMNPGLYDQLQEKLHDGLHTRKSVCAAFRNMRKFIFQGSVSWEKIIALFAFTGALVVECILQNNPEHVVIVLYSMKHFAENELTDWISQRNGWVSFNLQQISEILIVYFTCVNMFNRLGSLNCGFKMRSHDVTR